MNGDGRLQPDVEQPSKSRTCDLGVGVFKPVSEIGIDGVEDLDRFGRSVGERPDGVVCRSVAPAFGPSVPAGKVDVAIALGHRAVRFGRFLPANVPEALVSRAASWSRVRWGIAARCHVQIETPVSRCQG